jgi:hypothetical protein
MAAIKSPDMSCTVANPSNATAQLSLKALAWRALSPSSIAGVASVAQVAGVAAVADRPVYALRMHLLALVDRNGLDQLLVRRLHDLDMAACTGLDDAQLSTFLHQLDDTATRWAGKVPLGHMVAIYCHGCGPLYVHPGMAAVLPVVRNAQGRQLHPTPTRAVRRLPALSARHRQS